MSGIHRHMYNNVGILETATIVTIESCKQHGDRMGIGAHTSRCYTYECDVGIAKPAYDERIFRGTLFAMRELRVTARRTWGVVEWGLSRAVMERIMMMRTQTALSALPWLLPKALPPAPSLLGPPDMCTVSQQCSPGTACACPAGMLVRAVLHEGSNLRTMPRLHSNVARRRVWHSSGSSSA